MPGALSAVCPLPSTGCPLQLSAVCRLTRLVGQRNARGGGGCCALSSYYSYSSDPCTQMNDCASIMSRGPRSR